MFKLEHSFAIKSLFWTIFWFLKSFATSDYSRTNTGGYWVNHLCQFKREKFSLFFLHAINSKRHQHLCQLFILQKLSLGPRLLLSTYIILKVLGFRWFIIIKCFSRRFWWRLLGLNLGLGTGKGHACEHSSVYVVSKWRKTNGRSLIGKPTRHILYLNLLLFSWVVYIWAILVILRFLVWTFLAILVRKIISISMIFLIFQGWLFYLEKWLACLFSVLRFIHFLVDSMPQFHKLLQLFLRYFFTLERAKRCAKILCLLVGSLHWNLDKF